MLVYVNCVCAYIHTPPLSIYIFMTQFSFTILFFKQGFPQPVDQDQVQMPFAKDGDSTTSLSNLCPSSVILKMEKSFLMLLQNLQCFSLCPSPLVLSLGTREEPGSVFAPSSRYLHTVLRCPRALSSPG